MDTLWKAVCPGCLTEPSSWRSSCGKPSPRSSSACLESWSCTWCVGCSSRCATWHPTTEPSSMPATVIPPPTSAACPWDTSSSHPHLTWRHAWTWGGSSVQRDCSGPSCGALTARVLASCCSVLCRSARWTCADRWRAPCSSREASPCCRDCLSGCRPSWMPSLPSRCSPRSMLLPTVSTWPTSGQAPWHQLQPSRKCAWRPVSGSRKVHRVSVGGTCDSPSPVEKWSASCVYKNFAMQHSGENNMQLASTLPRADSPKVPEWELRNKYICGVKSPKKNIVRHLIKRTVPWQTA